MALCPLHFWMYMALPPLDPVSALAELGRINFGSTELGEVLSRVTVLARSSLSGAAEVSITLVRSDEPYTAAFTGDIALRLDEEQYRRKAGPCLEAAAGMITVAVPDTAADPRWDGWAAEAAAAGSGSTLSIGLPILDSVHGALNLYGGPPRAFGEPAVRFAQTFASSAAVVLANAHLYDSTARLARHMRAAMENRAVIEQAKGIIMGERRCTPDEAFAILTRISQDSNRKVRDVAAALVDRTQAPQSR